MPNTNNQLPFDNTDFTFSKNNILARLFFLISVLFVLYIGRSYLKFLYDQEQTRIIVVKPEITPLPVDPEPSPIKPNPEPINPKPDEDENSDAYEPIPIYQPVYQDFQTTGN